MELQKNIFKESEGNQWFKRNLAVENISEVFKSLGNYLNSSSRVLEIGCSYGKNLNYLNENFGCECYGIDPSEKAINHGSKIYPELNLNVGTADDIKFSDEYFDMVIYGFCLYLVDRRDLSKIVSEGDRLIKDTGYLAVIDFDTPIPLVRKYVHYSGVKTFKYDYSSIFLSFPHYSLAEKVSFSHQDTIFNEDINERCSLTVLFKNHDAYFNIDSQS